MTSEAAEARTGRLPFEPPVLPAVSVWQPRWVLLLAAALVAAAAAALPVDRPLAQWCHNGQCPGGLRNLFETGEPFGDGVGVLLIVLAVWILDPRRRWAVPRVLACSWGAGMAANVVKLAIFRWRPHALWEHGLPGDVWSTFGGWFPLFGAGSDGQSFPSAHAATAAGLAMALVWLYPRGRWLFAALVVLVACHRVQSGAHYLSDVLCGAAVGIVVAAVCLNSGPVVRWFDRRERHWRASRGDVDIVV